MKIKTQAERPFDAACAGCMVEAARQGLPDCVAAADQGVFFVYVPDWGDFLADTAPAERRLAPVEEQS